MLKVISFLSLLITSVSFGQVSGALAEDDRAITSDISYTISAKTEGVLVFDISVDINGNITACSWNKVESTIPSRRLSYEAKNRILTQLKFEAGTKFPKFHQGRVTITGVIEP